MDRLYLALGCCKGIAALHDFSPDLCHRDIKSFNFLGDVSTPSILLIYPLFLTYSPELSYLLSLLSPSQLTTN